MHRPTFELMPTVLRWDRCRHCPFQVPLTHGGHRERGMSMKRAIGWIAVISAVVLLGFFLLRNGDTPPSRVQPSEPPETEDPCQPLPAYLAELEIMPSSFPGAKVPIIIEFQASGPDPGGRIREYEWSYAGESRKGERVQFTLEKRGTNIINLRATDLSGCTVHRRVRIPAT